METASLIVQKLKQASCDVIPFMNSQPHTKLNFLKETDVYEILHLLNRIGRKSAGPDEIFAKVLNVSKEIITPFLTDICDQVLKSGVYPEVLKVAKVIPIHKSGKKTASSNHVGQYLC